MKYAQHWGAIGDHSGDAYFDFCYLPDWPRTLNELDRFRKPPRRDRPAARTAQRQARARRRRRRPRQALPRSRVGQGQAERRRRRTRSWSSRWPPSYDPDPKAPLGFRLPVDLDTGELIPKRWAQWLSTIPSISSAATRGTSGRFRGIYIDCGWRDQYHLHFGARILSRRARGPRHPAHLRGVRRHALVDRLPDGREPAVSLQVAQTLRSPTMRAIRSERAGRRDSSRWPSVLAGGVRPTPTPSTPPSNNADFEPRGRARSRARTGTRRSSYLDSATGRSPPTPTRRTFSATPTATRRKFDLAFRPLRRGVAPRPEAQGRARVHRARPTCWSATRPRRRNTWRRSTGSAARAARNTRT